MEKNIETVLHRDEFFSIAKQLSFLDLMNLCASSKTINNLICLKDDIWNVKLKTEFPNFQVDPQFLNISKKDLYILTLIKERYKITYYDIYKSYATSQELILSAEFKNTSFPLEVTYLSNLNISQSEMSMSKHLKHLSLPYNNIESLPKEIGNLINLTTLILNHNHLTELPSSFSNLINLESLYLGNNNFTIFPKEIFKLSNLKTLYFFHNLLQTIPKEIEQLKNLQILHLNQNKLLFLPEEIGNLPNLRVLNIADNKILALPKNFENLKSLKYLDYNYITDKEILKIKEKLPHVMFTKKKRTNIPMYM